MRRKKNENNIVSRQTGSLGIGENRGGGGAKRYENKGDTVVQYMPSL